MCIVARNEDKMKKKCEELKALNKDVETMCIVADFSKMVTIAEY